MMKKKLFSGLLLGTILMLLFAIPVSAKDPGITAVVVVATGGDASVGIDISSGGNTNVSVNGDGLATASQVSSLARSMTGDAYSLFTHLTVRKLDKWAKEINPKLNDMGINLNELNDNTQVVAYLLDEQGKLIATLDLRDAELMESISNNTYDIKSLQIMLTKTNNDATIANDILRAEMASEFESVKAKYDNQLFWTWVCAGAMSTWLIIAIAAICIPRRQKD